MIQFVRLILMTLLLFSKVALSAQIIDSQSGLLIDEGFKAVKRNCSSCHSLALIVQNKANWQGWLDTIRWMQKTQGMPLLNKQDEEKILNYLSKNYATNNMSRRAPLVVKKWHK